MAHEKELKAANSRIRDLESQKEAALSSISELKIQVKLAEESCDTRKRELLEANRKLREGLLFYFIIFTMHH